MTKSIGAASVLLQNEARAGLVGRYIRQRKPRLQTKTMKIIPLTNSKCVASVDESDYALAAQFSWRCNYAGYAIRFLPRQHKQKRRSQFLHNLLMGVREGYEVDHRDTNGLNCLRSNLRWATTSQNQANRRKSGDTSSRYKGVYLIKPTGRWHAGIKFHGKQINLGNYLFETDAAAAYNIAAAKYFGEFARLNIL